MATYDLEEQEQLSAIKTWWQMHGNLITTIAVVAAVAVVSYQGWQWYQRGQSAQASAVYAAVQKAVAEKDAKKAKEAAGTLLDDEKSYDEALKQLEREPLEPFAARYAEMRGDIYAAQNKRNEAKAAYQTAIAKIAARPKSGPESTANAAYGELLQVKLEALGDGQ
ncbi:MAG: hypothetical protein H6R11_483 [Proteobacteria bacterium]|nr:hypothetical protein [Pseudomonadota bacterium]